MIRIGICDDQEIFVKMLRDIIQTHEQAERFNIVEFANGEQVLKYFDSNNNIDILFLDIDMPGINGVELAEKIRIKNYSVIIIYVTNHEQYVKEAFRVGAFQYLDKSGDGNEMLNELSRAIEKIGKTQRRISAKANDGNVSIDPRKVMYVEKDKRKTFYVTQEERYYTYDNMNSAMDYLEGLNFVKVHRAFLVNLHYIYKIGREEVTMINGDQIPISRNYKTELKVSFNRYNLM